MYSITYSFRFYSMMNVQSSVSFYEFPLVAWGPLTPLLARLWQEVHLDRNLWANKLDLLPMSMSAQHWSLSHWTAGPHALCPPPPSVSALELWITLQVTDSEARQASWLTACVCLVSDYIEYRSLYISLVILQQTVVRAHTNTVWFTDVITWL